MSAPRGAGRRLTVAGARAMGELLELHTPHAHVPELCRECLTDYPCRTRQLLDVITGTPAPTQEGSP